MQEKQGVLISLDTSGLFNSLQYSSIRNRFASLSLSSPTLTNASCHIKKQKSGDANQRKAGPLGTDSGMSTGFMLRAIILEHRGRRNPIGTVTSRRSPTSICR
ncbi:hypothetical protein AVEN_132953-1 [Araneus ventricosus]|uniref:Uncharacterized protein n=1 Tax=Araneus ventricosus TaxID=182803 RepID=A0A4Y2SHU7_ARAVE|nr:hypothetical protein AVEN_132953-1 [Araneus ventricosus]